MERIELHMVGTRSTGQMAGVQNDAKLQDACQQFEAYFIANLMKEMRKTIPNDGFIPRGRAESIFQEMLDTEYATRMSQTQSVGLAMMLYRQLSGTEHAGDTTRSDAEKSS